MDLSKDVVDSTSVLGPRPIPTNPRDLMWAYQIRSEHKHLLTRVDELTSSITAIEQQQATAAGQICTIDNLEQTRTAISSDIRDIIKSVQDRLASIEETATSTTHRFEAFWEHFLTDLVRPLIERTTLLETNLEEAYEKLECLHQMLPSTAEREAAAAAAAAANLSSSQLQEVAKKPDFLGLSYAEEHLDQVRAGRSKNHQAIPEPKGCSEETRAAKATKMHKRSHAQKDSSSVGGRCWRDSAISMQFDTRYLQETEATNDCQQNEPTFSQATTVEDNISDFTIDRSQILAADTAPLSEFSSLGRARPGTICLVKADACPDSTRKETISSAKVQQRCTANSTPSRSLSRLVSPNRRATIVITDSIPSAKETLSPFYRFESASTDSYSSNTDLQLKGPGTQSAVAAFDEERHRREEPSSPTPTTCTSQIARPCWKRSSPALVYRVKEKRRSPAERHRAVQNVAKTIKPSASTKRRRTIPSTVDELHVEMHREKK